MFTTAQFRVFTTEPEERALARPRHLLREGQRTEAETSYRGVLAEYPGLKAAWAEYFQLLRAEGRFDDALALAARASMQFGDDAFPFALRGAALIEMGRLPEALGNLEESARRDPNFGMVWHEMGYAAYRLGQSAPALLALDRAFALDPRSGTLHLRGKILRTAGRYLAAEVAFSGAAEAAEFPEQRVEAEKQIAITRRYAGFSGKPADLPPHQRWFAETGAALLTSTGEGDATDLELLAAFGALAASQSWSFSVLVSLDDWDGWDRLAETLAIPRAGKLEPGFGMEPLVVMRCPTSDPAVWYAALRDLHAAGRGTTFALDQPDDLPSADVVGRLTNMPGSRVDAEFARACVEHPESRWKKD